VSSVRFVALGDSITVGLGDPMPDGSWRGWAALLAESLGPPGEVEFHNIAESGALTGSLAERQLPKAIELRPTVAAVVVGVNDTLRGSFDVARTGHALDRVVSQLRATGATVLTVRLPDPGRMLGLPRMVSRPLARRVAAINAVTDAVSARHDTVQFDAAGHPATYDRRMWSVDRLHPSERGHRLLATAFADLLTARGFPVHNRPGLEPTNPTPTWWASVAWMATKGTTWLYHRSTDLVPALAALSLAEGWYGLRGMARRLDQIAGAEVDRAIAALHHGGDIAYPSPSVHPEVLASLARHNPMITAS
jgi:lysophospholipase L1-like esterase